MNKERGDSIRLAALSDIHVTLANHRFFMDLFSQISQNHDAVLVAGDLTDSGSLTHANLVAKVFSSSRVPVYAVLGNHDLFRDDRGLISHIIEDQSKAKVLQGHVARITKGDRMIQVAGVTGHSGGFAGYKNPSPDPEDRVELSRQSKHLNQALAQSASTETIVLMHYAPIVDTLQGEPSALLHLLGSSRFETIIDRYIDRVKLVLHGHAHHGSFSGYTQGGILVKNVALPVLQKEFRDDRLFITIEI